MPLTAAQEQAFADVRAAVTELEVLFETPLTTEQDQDFDDIRCALDALEISLADDPPPPPPPGAWTTGQFKPVGIPQINWDHPLTAGLLFYAIDTGEGQYVNLVPGRPMVGAAHSIPIVETPFGYAFDWSQSFDGSVSAGWTADADGDAIIRDAENLKGKGSGAGFAFACGCMMRAAENRSHYPRVFGRMFAADEIPPYTHWDFVLLANTHQIALEFDDNHGQGIIPNFFTAPLGEYATLAASFVNTSAGSGTAKFYAQGNLVGSKSGVQLTHESGGSAENQIIIGAIYHVITHVTYGSFPGSVFWGAVWGRDLTSAEAALLHSDPYCFLMPSD